MSKCPSCGRSFKNTPQDHVCKKTISVDDYILEQPEEVQPLLQQGIAQCAHHVFLAHHLLEAAGPVFAGEHDIGHTLHSTQRTPLGPRGCRIMRPHEHAAQLPPVRGRL